MSFIIRRLIYSVVVSLSLGFGAGVVASESRSSAGPQGAAADAVSSERSVATAQSITINDPRPVAKAMEQLEATFGWPITYEDPPYIDTSKMVDITGQVYNAQSFTEPKARFLIPRGAIFSFKFEAPSGKADYRWAKAQATESL